MVWAGSPFAHLIEFSTGLPTSAVSFQLLGNDGSVKRTGNLTVASDALSHLLVIDGADNDCDAQLFENRTLTYSYTTASGLVSERIPYRVQKPLPFAASPEGVRSKLGIEAHELKDEEIDLVTAYAEMLTYGDPSAYVATGDRNTLLVIHGIEALAALLVLYTLQLKIASKESSGTNEFSRYGNVDWSMIEAQLQLHVAKTRALLDPTYTDLIGTIFSFGVAGRATDAVTAEGN